MGPIHIDLNTAIIIGVSILAIYAYARYNKSGVQFDESKADSMLEQAHQAKQKGEHEHQEYLLKKLAELYETGGGGDFSKRSSCFVHLSDCLARQGKPAEARQYMDKLLAYWRTILKQNNPDRFIDVDYFIATADFGSATNEIAEYYAEVIERKKQMFGPIHDEVANSMVLHSRLLAKLGEKTQAEELETHANEMREQLKTTRPPS
jgi:hypothetical protein